MQFLPNLLRCVMSTMNISLPETLKAFVDQQIDTRGFGTSSEYVRELIRKDQGRQNLRALLLAGAQIAPHGSVGKPYFAELRKSVAKKSAA
jgi:antitoxin ParD1/3/4